MKKEAPLVLERNFEKARQFKHLFSKVPEMVYYGYFEEGNNLNWVWLKNNGFLGEKYPTQVRLSPT